MIGLGVYSEGVVIARILMVQDAPPEEIGEQAEVIASGLQGKGFLVTFTGNSVEELEAAGLF